jgi:hypothetical protein
MDLGAIGHKIKAAFQALGHVLASAFVAVFGAQAASDFAKAAQKILASDFGKVVLTTVEGLQGVAVSQGGAVARDKAISDIATSAKSAGLDIKDSMIALLVELAVQKLKGTLDALNAVQ